MSHVTQVVTELMHHIEDEEETFIPKLRKMGEQQDATVPFHCVQNKRLFTLSHSHVRILNQPLLVMKQACVGLNPAQYSIDCA